jgi:hypothetical protein
MFIVVCLRFGLLYVFGECWHRFWDAPDTELQHEPRKTFNQLVTLCHDWEQRSTIFADDAVLGKNPRIGVVNIEPRANAQFNKGSLLRRKVRFAAQIGQEFGFPLQEGTCR